jgi:hypothetical protein
MKETSQNNFPFGKKSKFPIEFDLKNRIKQHLNLVWILKGFKPLINNSIDSSKFFLDLIFNIMNLDDLTCIKKIEVTLQVANMI